MVDWGAVEALGIGAADRGDTESDRERGRDNHDLDRDHDVDRRPGHEPRRNTDGDGGNGCNRYPCRGPRCKHLGATERGHEHEYGHEYEYGHGHEYEYG